MPQQIYPITDEEKAIGVVFKELFTSPDSCAKNGTILVGSPAVDRGITLDGATQYASNPKRLSLNGQGFIVLRFTPSFAFDEDVNRYLLNAGGLWSSPGNLSILKWNIASGALALTISLGGNTISCAAATYGPRWLVGQENILVVSLNGAASKVWLNGYDVGSVGAAMLLQNVGSITIGAKYDGNFKFAGSIQSLIIGNRPLTQGCEERLITSEPLSRIRTEASLVTIPGVQAYNRASDGKRVTPLLGKIATQHGVREAVLGDGSTATTFPTLISPRGFSFDGGDYLNLGDNDAFTFADDAGDKPFSLVSLVRFSVNGANLDVVAKGNAVAGGGEYFLYRRSTNVIRCVITDSVNLGGAYIDTNLTVPTGVPLVVTLTYSGTGLSGTTVLIYVNGVNQATTVTPFGVYTRMRNTAFPLVFGVFSDFASLFISGNIVLPEIYDVELSECEVRALTARMQRQARIGS